MRQRSAIVTSSRLHGEKDGRRGRRPEERGWMNERVVVVKSPPPSFWEVPAAARDRARPRIAVQAALWRDGPISKQLGRRLFQVVTAQSQKSAKGAEQEWGWTTRNNAKETQGHIGGLASDYTDMSMREPTSVLDRGHFSTVAAETVSRIS